VGSVSTFPLEESEILEARRLRMSEKKETKAGDVSLVPKGAGSAPGRPVEEVTAERPWQAKVAQGFSPITVVTYTPEKIQEQIIQRARDINKDIADPITARQALKRDLVPTKDIREMRTPVLHANMDPCIKQCRLVLLALHKTPDEAYEILADAMAKADFADWEIKELGLPVKGSGKITNKMLRDMGLKK
jgi:hypothetical protein